MIACSTGLVGVDSAANQQMMWLSRVSTPASLLTVSASALTSSSV